MDYTNRYRIKIWGTARIVEDDPDLIARVSNPAYPGKPEQAIIFNVSAWDRNCPQHIPRRYSEDDVAAIVAPLHARIAELEAGR